MKKKLYYNTPFNENAAAGNEDKGHSEDHFGAYRNYWWNESFLQHALEHLQLHHHQKLLDIGCGRCHWSKLLLPYLAPGAEIQGVDSDKKWAMENNALKSYFNQKGASFNLNLADVKNLPFEDNYFDVVTCQTVLIHVDQPALALQEMKRVLKPGGIILLAEPNNRIQMLTRSSFSANDSIEETLDHVKYALICEQGKKKTGHGDNSIGDLLPGMLAQIAFKNIEVRISDKAIPMYPPYEKREQEATLQQWAKGNKWPVKGFSDRDYFEAAGKEYLEFYHEYQSKYKNKGEKLLNAIEDEEFHSAGGALMYLISAVK